MEFDDMTFRIRFSIAGPREDELDPKFGIVGRRFDYAVNDGDVVSSSLPFSAGEVAVEGLKPGDTVASQTFNIDKTGRASEPAEVIVSIPTPQPPPVLPVPNEPTFVIEEVADTSPAAAGTTETDTTGGG
jgi:hypothetical protein